MNGMLSCTLVFVLFEEIYIVTNPSLCWNVLPFSTVSFFLERHRILQFAHGWLNRDEVSLLGTRSFITLLQRL